LQALARRHPGRLTVPQLGALSNLSHKGRTFSSYFGELQRRELIDVAGRDDVGITEAGFEAIGADPPAELQSPAELVAMWRERLPAAAVPMLDALIEAYPGDKVPGSGGLNATVVVTMSLETLQDLAKQAVRTHA